MIRRRSRACCLFWVWLSLGGATHGAKAEAGPDAPAPDEPHPADGAATEAQGTVNCQHERYVVLGAREGFDPALAAEVRKDLAAELATRGIGVCVARVPDGELAAEIWLSLPEPALVSIHVDDLVTGKRVARDVPLARIPAGGSALAIAIAADELLRASWAELSLPRRDEREGQPGTDGADAAAAGPSADAAVHRVVNAHALRGEERARVRQAGWLTLGAVLGYTRSPSAWNALGGELRVQGRPLGWGWLEGGMGGFGALEVESAAGSARARGFSAGLSLGACAPEARRLRWCGGARGALQWLRFHDMKPSGEAKAREGRGLPAIVVSAVGQLGLRLSKQLLGLFELSFGGAALGAEATAGGDTVMGVSGFVLSTGVGLGFQP